MVIVLGPRIPTGSVRVPSEVEVLGHYPRLYELYACCDVAVTQCGASSTTELSALRTPFIYFPIEGHFEQELVASRLVRYDAGKRMSLKTTSPEMLAEAINQLYGHNATWGYMPIDGASKAANHILQVLDERSLKKKEVLH
jgi:UDP:flavonoid glycosyltransferase YjiC (YdhE family)